MLTSHPLLRCPPRCCISFRQSCRSAARTTIPPLKVVQPLGQQLHARPVIKSYMKSVPWTARKRLAGPATLPFALVRHIRWISFAAGVHRHLWCTGLLTGQRSRNSASDSARGERPRCHAACASAEPRNDFRRRGVGILAALAAGRLLMHTVDGMRPRAIDFRHHDSPPGRSCAVASFLPARRASG